MTLGKNITRLLRIASTITPQTAIFWRLQIHSCRPHGLWRAMHTCLTWMSSVTRRPACRYRYRYITAPRGLCSGNQDSISWYVVCASQISPMPRLTGDAAWRTSGRALDLHFHHHGAPDGPIERSSQFFFLQSLTLPFVSADPLPFRCSRLASKQNFGLNDTKSLRSSKHLKSHSDGQTRQRWGYFEYIDLHYIDIVP